MSRYRSGKRMHRTIGLGAAVRAVFAVGVAAPAPAGLILRYEPARVARMHTVT